MEVHDKITQNRDRPADSHQIDELPAAGPRRPLYATCSLSRRLTASPAYSANNCYTWCSDQRAEPQTQLLQIRFREAGLSERQRLKRFLTSLFDTL